MRKKLLIGLGVVVLLAIGGAFWVRSVFGQDTVRVALADQLAKALGQPVTVGSISAAIYPRVTVTLGDVAIGNPARIQVKALDVGTNFGALLSRRIEHATLHLNGARLELPLPDFTFTSNETPATDSSSPVEVVSIDEIILNGVEVVSGGRSLRGDIDLVPQGKGVVIRKIALNADDTSLNVTGTITDLAGPSGELTIKAGILNVDRLLAFANEFSAGATAAPANPANLENPANPANPANLVNPLASMNLVVTLEAEKATLGAMAIEKLTGRATVKGQDLALDPLAFTLFGGKYDGTMGVRLGEAVPSFRWNASVSNIDVAAAAAFAGSPNTVSGRLGGRVNLEGSGADAATAMKTVHGSARLDVTNGVVKNLGLIRTVVAATSMNTTAVTQAASGSRDEPFTKLGGTFQIGNGTATTSDLLFESPDVTLTAAGTARLDATALNFKGQVRLSEALSKQSGGNAYVKTAAQENGRLTLPATVTGPADNPQVRIDAGDVAKRALQNTVNEQGKKALEKGLGGLFRR